MQSSKYYLLLVAILALVMPVEISAQTNTINTFSTYSMYGLGELQNQGTLATRSMGGAGVAMRSMSSINLLNPASYSIALRKGVLFDYGMEGGSYFASQNINGSRQSGSYTTANFHNIALQIPVAKGLGMGFSVTPYSEVGYRQLSDSIDPTLGYINTEYSGSGGVTEVKFGVGWEIMTGLSIGVAAQYYWGNIDREFESEITNMVMSGTVVSVSGVDNISVSRVKGQIGLQADLVRDNQRVISVGATYDIGGELKPRTVRAVTGLNRYEDVYAQNDTTTMSIVLPRQLSVGVEISNAKYQILADVNYQGWAVQNGVLGYTSTGIRVGYNNTLTARVGVQYTPRRGDVRHYMNRVQYRVGARYGGYQYTYGGESLTQYAVTAGMGFPLKMIGISKIDVGLEWGGVGTLDTIQVSGESIGLVKENHLKFSLGFTLFGDDYWFVRPQID